MYAFWSIVQEETKVNDPDIILSKIRLILNAEVVEFDVLMDVAGLMQRPDRIKHLLSYLDFGKLPFSLRRIDILFERVLDELLLDVLTVVVKPISKVLWHPFQLELGAQLVHDEDLLHYGRRLPSLQGLLDLQGHGLILIVGVRVEVDHSECTLAELFYVLIDDSIFSDFHWIVFSLTCCFHGYWSVLNVVFCSLYLFI
jgi:hypothetical protein